VFWIWVIQLKITGDILYPEWWYRDCIGIFDDRRVGIIPPTRANRSGSGVLIARRLVEGMPYSLTFSWDGKVVLRIRLMYIDWETPLGMDRIVFVLESCLSEQESMKTTTVDEFLFRFNRNIILNTDLTR
jgi:hypothetical protein